MNIRIMNNEYKNHLKSAFTLIEMIIVMAIIGVLAWSASQAIVSFKGIRGLT